MEKGWNMSKLLEEINNSRGSLKMEKFLIGIFIIVFSLIGLVLPTKVHASSKLSLNDVDDVQSKDNGSKESKGSFQEWVAEVIAPVQAPVWPEELSTEVKTPLGKLNGAVHENIRIFRGIPYAEAPVGERRFAPPEKVHAWSGVKDATKFGSMSYQNGQGNFSEDCLFLNVWTPAKSQLEALPVYVFIHGGGNVLGAGSQPLYESTELAKAGIVVVTINYRLNSLGFLPSKTTYQEYGTTGNWAILDMICAIEWVRDNIKSFGGDPSRITIGGESAGSFGVSALISSPRAKGLFQQAIMESGALPMSKAVAPMTAASYDNAMTMGEHFFSCFGVIDSPNGLVSLRNIPAQDVWNVTFPMGELINPQTASFWPIPDGNVIPKNPVQEIKKGNINRVKLLVGFNTDEGSIFVNPDSAEKDYPVMAHSIFGENASAILKKYPVTTEYNARQRVSDLITLSMIRSGMYLYADALSKLGEDVYAYRFDFVDPALQDTSFGVAHGSELKYIFHNYMQHVNHDEKAKVVADQMYVAWTNFIKNGDPNKGTPLPQNEKWENYSDKNRVEMRITEKSEMEPLYKVEDVDFINQMMHGN
jgi:para-nitrobenzyl esterase